MTCHDLFQARRKRCGMTAVTAPKSAVGERERKGREEPRREERKRKEEKEKRKEKKERKREESKTERCIMGVNWQKIIKHTERGGCKKA